MEKNNQNPSQGEFYSFICFVFVCVFYKDCFEKLDLVVGCPMSFHRKDGVLRMSEEEIRIWSLEGGGRLVSNLG